MESLKDLPRHQHCDNLGGRVVPGLSTPKNEGMYDKTKLPSERDYTGGLPTGPSFTNPTSINAWKIPFFTFPGSYSS